MPKPYLGPLPIPTEADILEAGPPPSEMDQVPQYDGPGGNNAPTEQKASPLASRGSDFALSLGERTPPGMFGGDEYIHLRHVLVERLLEDQTLGLLLQGTSIVGFGSSQAEDCGWLIGDQIVEVNGKRVGAFEEFLDHFKDAQEQGFPIDFSVLRREVAPESALEANEALDGFFRATDLEGLAGLMQRKFGASRSHLEPAVCANTALEADDGPERTPSIEAIVDNPYIQALRKRREDLSKTAEGWVVDEGGESLAVQLATQSSGGLATLTVEMDARHVEDLDQLPWTGCASASSQPCDRALASVGAGDIQPTPRVDPDMAVSGWAGLEARERTSMGGGPKGPIYCCVY